MRNVLQAAAPFDTVHVTQHFLNTVLCLRHPHKGLGKEASGWPNCRRKAESGQKDELRVGTLPVRILSLIWRVVVSELLLSQGCAEDILLTGYKAGQVSDGKIHILRISRSPIAVMAHFWTTVLAHLIRLELER